MLGALAVQARNGDRNATAQVLASLRDDVYRLALRMTGVPADAEDATQEVLLKIVTHLSTWRDDARITTWAHRITVNHLLDRKRSPIERQGLSFEAFGDDLQYGLAADNVEDDAFAAELLDEVRLGCTMAMLQCLDRDHRIAYILGELFDVAGEDAAWICEVSHATFRKRLSRARERVREFMRTYCGHVEPSAICR